MILHSAVKEWNMCMWWWWGREKSNSDLFFIVGGFLMRFYLHQRFSVTQTYMCVCFTCFMIHYYWFIIIMFFSLFILLFLFVLYVMWLWDNCFIFTSMTKIIHNYCIKLPVVIELFKKIVAFCYKIIKLIIFK